MKKQFWIYAALLVTGLQSQRIALAGTGSHGGDLQCDAYVKLIAKNIESWIRNGGPQVGRLNLSTSRNPKTQLPYTLAEYSSEMLDLLGKPLDVSCVSKGDPGYPVMVEGSIKVCKNEVDEKGIHMVCDRGLFLALNADLQIQQIHHEYATDVPGLEPDDGPFSTYQISTQLSAFVTHTREARLAVTPANNPFKKFIGSYVGVSQDCSQNNEPWNPLHPDAPDEVLIEQKAGIHGEEEVWITKNWKYAGSASHNLAIFPNYPWLRINGYTEDDTFVELRILGDSIEPETIGKAQWEERTRITQGEDQKFTLLESTVRTDKATGTTFFSRICTTVFQKRP